MLRPAARFIALLAVASTAQATLPDAIIGWWRNDNEERFAEIQLREDGRFASLARNNAIIAVVPLQEQSGTWHLRGSYLALDGTDGYSQERTQKQLQVIRVTDRMLRVRTVDGHIDTYRRITYPACTDKHPSRDSGVSKKGVVGRWRGHYRTHEIEVVFGPKGNATVRYWDPGHRSVTTSEGRWRLAKSTLTITPLDKDGKMKWFLAGTNEDCISFTVGDGMAYGLQRVR